MKPDTSAIQLVCAACGHTFETTMHALQRQPELACPACDELFVIDTTPIAEPMSHADSVLADLDKVLSGFGRLRGL